MHSIGFAAYLSRHFVLRGMDDEQEFRAFEHEFKLIPAEERQRLYTDRKAHKEVVCFLHEWGHTLGLIHHEDRKQIMNPAYDPQQTEFSDYDKRILALVIERRLAARDVAVPRERGPVAAVGGDAGRAKGRTAERALPAGPGHAGGRAYAARPVAARRTPSICRPPTSTAFNKAVEALQRRSRQPTRGRLLAPVVEHARERKVDQPTWLRIADLAAAIGALTEADEAAGRAGRSPEAQKIAREIESTRHRIALPLDAAKLGVPPEREPAYVSGLLGDREGDRRGRRRGGRAPAWASWRRRSPMRPASTSSPAISS